jgi:queuosine precursor transporter
MRKFGLAVLAAYIATIPAANWLVTRYGPVPVGFGLFAPAGVYLAGLAFTLRDLVQESLGRRAVLAAIAAGTVLSLLLADGRIAVASGTAFLLSEVADFAVYTPLRQRRFLLAVAASNTVGLLLDSVVFLWLAFGSLAFLPGQLVGKALMTLAALPVLWLARRAFLPRHA